MKQKNLIKHYANRCTVKNAAKILAQNQNISNHHHHRPHIPVLGALSSSRTNTSFSSSTIKTMPNDEPNISTDYSQISVNNEPENSKIPQSTPSHLLQKDENKAIEKQKVDKIKAKSLKRRRRQRSFGCDKCNKRFSQKSELHKHAETHLSAKPFECNRCKKRFSTKQRLNGHRDCYVFDKDETILALVNIKLHKTKVLDRKKKHNDELYRVEYMEQGKAKKIWISAEQCPKYTSANIAKQQHMAKQAEYVLSDEKYVYKSADMFGSHPVLCPFPCNAKLSYVEAKGCYNGSCMFCNYCERQIGEAEWAYHCEQKGKVHPKGFDLCSKCAKRKAIFDHKHGENRT